MQTTPVTTRDAFLQGSLLANRDVWLEDANRGTKAGRPVETANPAAGTAGTDRAGDDRRVELNVGYPCNNSCVFCSEEYNRMSPVYAETQRGLTTPFLRRQIVLWRKEGFNHLTFIGGEPTIRRDFVELVETAGRAKYRTVFLTTNGRKMANPAFASALFDAGLTHVSFSLHGPDPETHNRVVRRKNSQEELVGGMLNTKALGRPFRLSTVWNAENIDAVEAMYDFLLEHRPVRAFWCFVRPVGEAHMRFDEVVPWYGRLRDPLRRVLARARADRFPLTVANVPLCIMGEENAGFSDELYWRQDEGEIWREINKFRAVHGQTTFTDAYVVTRDHFKRKHRDCAECKFVGVCDGLVKEYTERRGFGEIEPIRGEPITNPRELQLPHLLETMRAAI